MRLNRALEEVDKYKRLLEEASEAAKGGQQGAQTDLQRLRMENKKCAPPPPLSSVTVVVASLYRQFCAVWGSRHARRTPLQV